MEKHCYICGAVGFEELLATCMDCKSSYIHLYCMKTVQFIIPDDWICENCQFILNQEKSSCLPSSEQNSRKIYSVHAHVPPAVRETSSKQKSCIKYPVHARKASSISKPSPDLQNFKELFIPPTHTTSTISRRVFSQGVDPCKDTLKANKNAGEQRPIFGKLSMNKCLPNHPTSYATWKGSFIPGFDASVCSCDTVWGYPPAKVRKKAYDFSKKMPDVLHFEAIPRCAVWETLFKDRGSHKDDIGLYFFPICDKSEESYFRLLSDIEEQDIVLKSCISGIMLLIFSSSCLDEKSREINKSYYMWGLFVPPGITFKKPDQNQLPAKINAAAPQHIRSNEQVLVMEIDMLMDKIEVPVPGDSVSTYLKPSNAGSQPASEVKTEKWDGVVLPSPPRFPAFLPEPRVPPGFEEGSRVKYKSMDEILNSSVTRKRRTTCVSRFRNSETAGNVGKR